MSALVAAAKKEGTLNVIALPADWANYGNIIKDFTAKYGIKVTSIAPTDSSAQERRGSSRRRAPPSRLTCWTSAAVSRLASTSPLCSLPGRHLGIIPAA